jgi:hypothetical protein
VAGDIDRAEGADRLRTLELFGEEAAELFRENPHGFQDLTAISRLDHPSLDVSTGPWREAVLQRARAGKLSLYRDHLSRLNADQQILLTRIPGCLPLLGRGASGAEAMLSRHGERAWGLFLANYDDLIRLVLVDGHTSEEVVEALDLLARQPEAVRALAPDSGRVLRLLLERRGSEPIGVEILSRCGPEAADLLFEGGG